MGNLSSTFNRGKIIRYVTDNDNGALCEYVKGKCRKMPKQYASEIASYALFTIIKHNVCIESIEFLLQYDPLIYKKFDNNGTMINSLQMMYENDSGHILDMLEKKELINMNDLKQHMVRILEYCMNISHSYKISLRLLQVCKDYNIDLEQQENIIHILHNFIIQYNENCVTILNYIIDNFSGLFHELFLHEFISKNYAKLNYTNICALEQIFFFLLQKYPDYANFVNDNGDTILMCCMRIICSKKNIKDFDTNIVSLFATNCDVHFINKNTKESVKDIICTSTNLSAFTYMQCFGELFDDKEHFVIGIKSSNNKSIPTKIINKFKSNVFTINDYTATGLHHALNAGNIDNVEIINDFDINTLDSLNRTIFDIALQKNYQNLINYLIEKNILINRISTFFFANAKISISPLSYACCYSTTNNVRILLNSPNIDIDFKNPDGTTAFLMSARLGKYQAPLLLLQKGADKMATDNNGNNVFNCSTLSSQLNTKIKSNIKATDYYNKNAVSAPPEEGATFICKICMDNQINVLFYPCKHAICCNSCYIQLNKQKKLNKCTVCTKNVDYVLDFKV